MCTTGIGGSLYGFLLFLFINPHNEKPNIQIDGEFYFDSSIANNVPDAFKYMSLI